MNTADIPRNEPAQLRAGLTWQWRREDLTEYPATTWTLTYWFKRQGGTDKFSAVATADGSAHAVNVSAATTAAYVADDYTWVAVATSGAEAYEVDRGSIRLLPKYNADAALDDRTHAKKMLESIEAALEAFSLGVQEYTIGTRTLKRTDLAELRSMHQYYRGLVGAENMAERRRNGGGGDRWVARF